MDYVDHPPQMKYTGTLTPYQKAIADTIIANLRITKEYAIDIPPGCGKHHIILAIFSDLQLSASWFYGKNMYLFNRDIEDFNRIISEYAHWNNKLSCSSTEALIHFVIYRDGLIVRVKNLLE